ncbi:phosphoglycerol transferase MdoB-like AlkP superfamily enzyme [Bacillus pakistanensis]|uniref:Phosphoglycerol transferase MdoB-like AlkP superfamily enzyme n=1 Tax=Rossellomorea pakistanensis TaxID=992288 RepID=A0ABS2NIJ3_9BACI|nr:hypothetical protein [Bacillus pakistanensis]MBM7587676.1 phosphoglycerol transferase MdoB-like AlkP superfamily enzyme [Bacillus pakistanensis]
MEVIFYFVFTALAFYFIYGHIKLFSFIRNLGFRVRFVLFFLFEIFFALFSVFVVSDEGFSTDILYGGTVLLLILCSFLAYFNEAGKKSIKENDRKYGTKSPKWIFENSSGGSVNSSGWSDSSWGDFWGGD